MASPQAAAKPELSRSLGLIDATAIVAGVVIGGGIFLVPNLVARNLPQAEAMLAAWALAGLMSFFGALACAELGAAIPATGGEYVFLREIYGPRAGFVYGWSMFLVARTAQIAWLSVTLAMYVSYFVALSAIAMKATSLGSLAVFAGINYAGVKAGAAAQRFFTLAKIVGLAAIIAGGLAYSGPHPPPAAAAPVSAAGFGVAMIACLLAYDGWVQVTFVAGEIKRPQKNVVRALAIGVAICIAIYMLANLAYLRVLLPDEIAASDHVGALAVERMFGAAGGRLVSAIILISIIGALNGCLLTSPRILFAQAKDGLWFRSFAAVHPRYGSPYIAIAAQGVWAAVLVVSGTYETLADYAMFAIWLFYGLTITGVLILRRKRPGLTRPYRVWGYPVTPLLFLIATGWFVVNTATARPGPSLIALAMVAAGIPAYELFRHRLAGAASG